MKRYRHAVGGRVGEWVKGKQIGTPPVRTFTDQRRCGIGKSIHARAKERLDRIDNCTEIPWTPEHIGNSENEYEPTASRRKGEALFYFHPYRNPTGLLEKEA